MGGIGSSKSGSSKSWISTISYCASPRFCAVSSTHRATSSDLRFGRVLPVMIPIFNIMSPSCGRLWVRAVSQTVFGVHSRADPADLGFTAHERIRVRVDRVVSEDESMRMRDRRAEHEGRVALRLDLD